MSENSLIEILRSILGDPPKGFEFLEYFFGFVLVLFGILLLYKLLNTLFSKFTSRKGR